MDSNWARFAASTSNMGGSRGSAVVIPITSKPGWFD
jgi:hypothetical protein